MKSIRAFGAILGAILLAVLVLDGCSVFMAAQQPGKKSVEVLAVGEPRSLVLAELGSPVSTKVKDGKRIDVFSFVQGYSKGVKTGRALFHGAADVFTIGLWELIGTPTEAVFSGDKMAFEVCYDSDEKVEKVTQLAGPGIEASAPKIQTEEAESLSVKAEQAEATQTLPVKAEKVEAPTQVLPVKTTPMPAKSCPDASIHLGKGVSAVAVGEGAVWVLAAGKLLQIDPGSNRVVATIPEVQGVILGKMDAGEGAVWVPRGDIFSPGIKRIDVTTHQVTATIPVVGNHVAVGHGSVWGTSMRKGTLSRVDPHSNQIAATITVGKSPTFVEADESAVWVLNNDDGTVSRIDPSTNQVVATIKFGSGRSSIWKEMFFYEYPAVYFGFAAGAGAVWITAYNHGVILRIDTELNEVIKAIPVGIRPALVAVCGSAVWVETDSALVRIDPRTDRVVETIQLLGEPRQRKMASMACSQETIWAVPGLMFGSRLERINFRP